VLRRFSLHEPAAIGDVPALLARYGDNGAILAGGTELLLVMKEGALRYENLINIKNIPGLDELKYNEEEGQLEIGCLVTHRSLEKSQLVKEKFPLIGEMEQQVANIRVRNMGTIGGNLCFGEPHSDVGNLLLSLGARVKAVGQDGERVIALEDFFVDFFETALRDDEILTQIQVPSLPASSSGIYLRYALAERPTIGVTVILSLSSGCEGIEDAVITIGCVNPTPVRSKEAEEALRGKEVKGILTDLGRISDLATKDLYPISDIHASEWYKREVVKEMVKRGIRSVYNRMVNKERV
jgi:carbon-monoxide dehydrogenase medium subunit